MLHYHTLYYQKTNITKRYNIFCKRTNITNTIQVIVREPTLRYHTIYSKGIRNTIIIHLESSEN